MPHRSFFISAAFVVLLFSFSATAQKPAPAVAPDKSKAASTKEKAVDLLKSIAGQVGGLSSAQNRVRLGSNAADLLWDIDEERARRLFSAVTEDLNGGLAQATADTLSMYSDGKNYYHTIAVFKQLRKDALERISRHDPQLALDFLRATRPGPDEQQNYVVPDSEVVLELQLASQIAAKSPELALKLGRKALAFGLRPELVAVLTQLNPRDKPAWQSYYKEIVDKLKTVNIGEDVLAEALALDLAKSFSPPQADEQAYRELLGILLADAVAQGCANPDEYSGSDICGGIGVLFPQVQKYYGSRAASLKHWGERAAEAETRERVLNAVQEASHDEALALAAKYPELEDDIYWQTMAKSTQLGDYARAREFALRVPNEEMRQRMLDQIKYVEAAEAETLDATAKQEEHSQPMADRERLDTIIRRGMYLARTNRKAALEGFDKGAQLIESLRPGKDKLEMQIGLAVLYASLQSDRGFPIVESMMPRLNELISAAATLDGVETNYLSEGEWNMSGAGTLGGLLTGLAQNAGHFSRLDFDRSLALANQLERSEVRLMAQLMMVQGVLSDRKSVEMSIRGN